MSNRDRLNQLPVRTYLDETVVPIMMQALSACARERPEDPVDFVANFLLKNNPRRDKLLGTNTANMSTASAGASLLRK